MFGTRSERTEPQLVTPQMAHQRLPVDFHFVFVVHHDVMALIISLSNHFGCSMMHLLRFFGAGRIRLNVSRDRSGVVEISSAGSVGMNVPPLADCCSVIPL